MPSRPKLWRNLALIWAVAIFASSSTVVGTKEFVRTVADVAPGAMTQRSFSAFWSSWWWVFVKGFHVMEFALLTLLLSRWLARKSLWLPLSLSAVYAATDEVHQLWVPARGGRVTDWLIDLIGILAVGLFVWISRRMRGAENS